MKKKFIKVLDKEYYAMYNITYSGVLNGYSVKKRDIRCMCTIRTE